MKKSLALIVVTVLLFFTGCQHNKLSKPTTNLEFWIGDNVDDVDFSDYQSRNGMIGGYAYYGRGYIPTIDENGQQIDPDFCVIYTITSYPDYSSKKQHITSISITDPSIELYGLSLDTPIEEIESTIENEGFKIEKTTFGLIAKKGKYSIRFFDNVIHLSVNVTNIFGIVF